MTATTVHDRAVSASPVTDPAATECGRSRFC